MRARGLQGSPQEALMTLRTAYPRPARAPTARTITSVGSESPEATLAGPVSVSRPARGEGENGLKMAPPA